ncbi:unnamed protein product [Tilletia controversa]|nr:unnamed protein product [Tilletia controversa]
MSISPSSASDSISTSNQQITSESLSTTTAAQYGDPVPSLQRAAARAGSSGPPLELATESAAEVENRLSASNAQSHALNQHDATTAPSAVDAQSIADAVTAPTLDRAWPPTLEEWHESREQDGIPVSNHISARSPQPIAVAPEPVSSSQKGKSPVPSSSLPSSLPRSLHSPGRQDSMLQTKPSKVQQLPQEVLMRLFSFLDPFGLASVALVCRNWAKVAMDDATWRGAFAIYFGLDWGSDEFRAPLKLVRGGSDEAQHELPEWLKGTDPAASMKARSIALRRLRPAKWKQEFIARWELARRWRKTKTQPISTNPSISTISQVAFAPPTSSHASSFLLSASLVYGVACRSDPFTGRRISMGFLDASGNTNGAGIGNPNVEFSPDVSIIAMGADARSIVWGFRTGQVSLTLLSKQGTNPRGLVRSIRFDEQSRHRGTVVDIALPLAAGNEGGARSVVRSPSRLAQHLSDLGDLAATFVSAGEDGTVRLWAWPLEKSHGGVGAGALAGHIPNNRKLPLWVGSVMDGVPAVPGAERRRTPSISKVAFNPAMGIVVAGSANGMLIVWSNLDMARLASAPAGVFGAAATNPSTSSDAGTAEWREELQQIYDAVKVTRFSVDPSRSQLEARQFASIEVAAPSTRRSGEKVDAVSIIVRLQGDSVLRRFDVAFRGPTPPISDGQERPWDRESYPRVRVYAYGLLGSESPITTSRLDFDTLSSTDRSRADPSAASSASPSPAPRSPSLLPTIPSRRNVGRVTSGSSSRIDRDPIRFTLPISAAYSDQLKIGDRGLYSERPFLVAGTESGLVLVWDWETEGKTIQAGQSGEPTGLQPIQTSFVEPSMAFVAHTSAISAIDLSPLAIIIGTVDGLIKVFNSLSGDVIRVFNDKAASRHPARMLAEGQLTEEQAAQFYVKQIIAGEDSLIVAIGPHVVAWRTEALAGKGKGHHSLVSKKAGPKARSSRAASWQTKYQASAELRADVKESAALLKKESKDRQTTYERMRWATGPPELGGLDDDEALEYAIMLSREETRRGSARPTDQGVGTSAVGDFDLDAALAQYDHEDHLHSREGEGEPSSSNSDDSGDGNGGEVGSSSAPSSPQLKGLSSPSRAWEILNHAGSATHSVTPDRWGSASKVRTVTVPRSARVASYSSAAGGRFAGSPSSSSSPTPAPGTSWQQRLSGAADADGTAWPSVSPPASTNFTSGSGRSPGMGAWSLGTSQAVLSSGITAAEDSRGSRTSVSAMNSPRACSSPRMTAGGGAGADDMLDDDLRFALELSMAEEQSRQAMQKGRQ